jgi:hypothetical protein
MFPWTERSQQAAIELFIDELQLDSEAKGELEKSIHDIAFDTPAAKLGATKVSKSLKKLGSGAASAATDILKSIATEAVKKILFPMG